MHNVYVCVRARTHGHRISSQCLTLTSHTSRQYNYEKYKNIDINERTVEIYHSLHTLHKTSNKTSI